MYIFSIFFLQFMLYSILGYICDIIFSSLPKKKFDTTSFLTGPWCPIYGIAILLMNYLLRNYKTDYLVVFIFGMLIASLIEYVSSYIIEKIFHNRWWDYSNRWDNINGRICLGNSLLFGVASILVVCFTYPLTEQLLKMIPNTLLYIITCVLFIIFAIDWIYSNLVAFELRHGIIFAEKLKFDKINKITDYVKKRSHKSKFFPIKIFKAFPDLLKWDIGKNLADAFNEYKSKEKTKQSKKKVK